MAPQSDHATPGDGRIPAGIVTGKDWVVSIEEPYPGEIWLGTTDGIVVVHAASGESRRIRRDSLLNTSLPSDTIETMYKDRSGLLWLGTPQGIAWRNMQTAALTLFGGFGRAALDSGDVYAVLQTEDRSVWLGLARGIQIIDATATKSRRLAAKPGIAAAELANAFVFTLAAGQSDQVYVGTQRGLFQVDGRSKQVSTVPIASNGKAPIVTALFAEKDHLWIGSDNGELWRLDFANSRVEKILGRDDKDRSPSPGIVAILPGPDGSLWILAPGLNRVDPITHTIEHVSVDSLNPSARVLTFFTDRKGRLWFSSEDGISRLEGRNAQGRFQFRHIGVKDGLPDANIDKILEAPDGHIWASTDDGIAVIDPETFGVRALHEADDVAIISYWRGSGSVTRDGELLFGGVGGLTILHPDRLTDWSFRPPVVISGIKIDGMPAAVDRPNDVAASLTPLVIQPEATSFSVEFSALDFSAPERNRYSYRLEGYDRTWIDTDADHRIAAYTNLAPGDYSLRVRGSNRNGVWTDPVLTLPVHVVAAWYQTWWFKLAIGLVAVLAVYALVQRRTAYLLRRQREIEGLIAERTNDLRESRNQLEQLAYHDSLTGLPNRRMFSDQFIHFVAIAERQRSRFALLLVDLDKFKEINDTLGHDAGDALLVAVAQLLQSATRKSDHVSRLGGDEFAVLLMPDHQSLDIETVCRRITEAFIPKIVFADKIMSTSPSIGVAMFPDHGRTQDGLYKAADLALYEAKCAGRNTWRLASDQTPTD
jgi:diguanylate cyclase (GGDEF)-like protein